jgi:hypothetical protein
MKERHRNAPLRPCRRPLGLRQYRKNLLPGVFRPTMMNEVWIVMLFMVIDFATMI